LCSQFTNWRPFCSSLKPHQTNLIVFFVAHARKIIWCKSGATDFIQDDSVARDLKLLSIKKLCYWDNGLKIYIDIPGTMQNRTCL